jgi:hypothetical protein
LTTAELANRFLLQATFGASKAALNSFVTKYGANYDTWFTDQVNLPPTFGRTYYRERANARAPLVFPIRLLGKEYVPGTITQICDLDTRWNRYVFDQRDLTKNLVVEKGTNKFLLKIDGQLRGEVDSFLGQPFPGSNITAVTFPATMRICTIREGINTPLKLSNTTDTTCTLVWLNPAIQFSSDSSAVQVLTDTQVSFVPVIGNNASFVLKTRSVSCSNTSDAAGNSYIRVGTNIYRFDPRIRLVPNLVNNPSPVAPNGTCPIVPRTYQNSANCARRPACTNLPGTEEACGSPSEVQNRPELGWHYMTYISDTAGQLMSSLEWPTQSGRDFVLVVNNLHFKANDQLRQRIAWSLANIVTIGFLDQDATQLPESWLSFYDIFVRNAFGNYLDILTDVSYHPLMSKYLTYLRNKAYAAQKAYPDENYAREIMYVLTNFFFCCLVSRTEIVPAPF